MKLKNHQFSIRPQIFEDGNYEHPWYAHLKNLTHPPKMQSEKQSSETKHLTGPQILDLETNGLLKNTTEIHCIAVHYVDEGYTVSYNDTGATEPIVRAVQYLQDAEKNYWT